jgi:hypothetical protein
MEPLAIVFSIATILLLIAAVFEFREYRRYVKAAQGVQALAASMQISFEAVGEHLTRINNRTINHSQGLVSIEQQINFMNAVLQVHSEALNLSLGKAEI